jgi:hypothetical protein
MSSAQCAIHGPLKEQEMRIGLIVVAAAAALLAASTGCSVGGAASTGFNFWKNSQSNLLDVKLFLDGQEAARDELEQMAKGYSKWTVSEKVSTAPTLRYELKNPGDFGRIRSIHVSIYQKFKGDFSHVAEFTVNAKSNESNAQMKPETDYDLGAPGEGFRVMDFNSKDVPGVKLTPGMDYMLVFTVVAEDSETAQVYFSTK